MSGRSEHPYRNRLVQRKTDEREVDKKIGRLAQQDRSEVDEASQTGFAKSLLQQELTQQKETKLGHVALILVRREALRRVLEEEKQLYNKELSQRHLAIYQQRI